jgi:hypothetical protein
MRSGDRKTRPVPSLLGRISIPDPEKQLQRSRARLSVSERHKETPCVPWIEHRAVKHQTSIQETLTQQLRKMSEIFMLACRSDSWTHYSVKKAG